MESPHAGQSAGAPREYRIDTPPPAAARAPEQAAEYRIYTLADHARTKGMWAGTLHRAALPDLQGLYPAPGGGAELRKIGREHTPALLKIIDEALVNATDHEREHRGAPRPSERVRRIDLGFCPETGQLRVRNDGPGLPIVPHPAATARAGHPVWVPEVAFAMFLAGRNLEKPPHCVKGGVNGIGAKLVNIHSRVFTLETASGGQVYRQTFRDRMRAREPPQVAEGKGEYTEVTFIPAYEELGYRLGAAGRLAPEDAEDLAAWCRWRMALVAAYVGPRVAVGFNGERCPTTSALAIARLATTQDPEAVAVEFAVGASEPPYRAHPWAVAAVVLPAARSFGHVSVINGVHCSKGAHLSWLKKEISAAVGAKGARATRAKDKGASVAEACRHIFLVVIGALPGADWSGQRKDELQFSEKKLRSYALPAAPLARLAGAVADRLLRGAEQAGGRRKPIVAEKYTGAREAGTRTAGACRLLLAEGDSALSLLRGILSRGRRAGGPSTERYGTFSLGGVIMNAQKQTKDLNSAIPGENPVIAVRTEALRNNQVLRDLEAILGLEFGRAYASAEERARLRYGGVVVCTDQDLDGTGKILPLVLVYFHRFWPALVGAGYVLRLATPVIRAYPRGGAKAPPLEFFYENEFAQWAGPEGGRARDYAVKYYKGLGSHDDDEVGRMVGGFEENLHAFALDPEAPALFEAYYGRDPAPRKEALSTPVVYPSADETRALRAAREVPCSLQLRVDAKAYKLDDLQRKLPGIDGIPVARRKVLAGALQRFSSTGREMKVFQLGGYVAEHMFYHHGDASLNGTIVGMAQRFPGALRYPYLSGIGQFGTRQFGGKDAASPRYISVRLAAPYARAVFPSEDMCLLPHVFEDGERAQPAYFLPVLPTALLESFEIPSEGWRHKCVARDLSQTVSLLRAYLEGDPLLLRIAASAGEGPLGTQPSLQTGGGAADLAELRARFPLEPSLEGYGSGLSEAERATLVRPYRGHPHSFGYYAPETLQGGGKVLRVTELPFGLSTEAFLRNLRKPPRDQYIREVVDESSGTDIDISIYLEGGAWGRIEDAYGDEDVDPVEQFCLLYSSLRPYLNFFGTRGQVLEFGDDYHALFFYWLPLRRDLYGERLRREAVLLSLRIRLEREIVRYIGAGLDLAREDDEAKAGALLAQHAFPLFDAGLLAAPGYVPTAELERRATAGPGVSHDYIFSLRERELVQAAKQRREEKLEAKAARLAEVERLLAEEPFAGVSVWRAEVEKVLAAVEKGKKTAWRF